MAFLLNLRSEQAIATKLVIAVLVFCGLVCSSRLTANENDDIERWESAIQSTIDKVNRRVIALGDGSGVVVDQEGLTLSVAHLFNGPNQTIKIPGARIRSTDPLLEISGTTLGLHRSLDLAALRISGAATTRPWGGKMTVKSASKLPDNTPVIAVGYPAGWPKDSLPVPRLGFIQRVEKHSGNHVEKNTVMTTAKLMGGDSGGGLFDLDGNLVAINASAGSSLEQNHHIDIQQFANHRVPLLSGANVLTPRAAVTGGSKKQAIPLQAYLGLVAETDGTRLRIRSVNQRSPAELAGLKSEDVLRSINGNPLASFDQLRRELNTLRPGQTVSIQLNRFGKLYQTRVTLGQSTPTSLPQETLQPLAVSAANPILQAISKSATQENSVVEIVVENQTIAMATLLSDQGLLVTKASELAPGGWRVQMPDGQQVIGTLLATDDNNDIALVRIDLDVLKNNNLRAIAFPESPSDVRSGSIVYSFQNKRERAPLFGIIGGSVNDWRPVGWAPSFDTGTGLEGHFDPAQGAFVVTRVAPRSPAEQAEILVGDKLHFFSGPLDESDQCEARFRQLEPGESLDCKFSRGGTQLACVFTKSRFAAHSSLDQWSGGPFSRRRFGLGPVLIHDLPLHPNMCGSPLRDSRGNVIGIHIARCTRSVSAAKSIGTVYQIVLERGLAQELNVGLENNRP